MVSILPTHTRSATLPETNIALANQWLEDEFPLVIAHFWRLLLIVRKSGKLTSYKLVVHPTISPGFYTHPNGDFEPFSLCPTTAARFYSPGPEAPKFHGFGRGNPQRFLLGTKPAKLPKVVFFNGETVESLEEKWM